MISYESYEVFRDHFMFALKNFLQFHFTYTRKIDIPWFRNSLDLPIRDFFSIIILYGCLLAMKLKMSALQKFSFILILITWILYFLKMIPIGPNRIGYFLLIPLTTILLLGAGKIKYFVMLILCSVCLQFYINEWNGQNHWFDQKAYSLYSMAIDVAQKNQLTIYILRDSGAGFGPINPELALKTHPKYLNHVNIPVKVIDSAQEILEKKNYVLILKEEFKVF